MSPEITVRNLHDSPSLKPAFLTMESAWPTFMQPSGLLVNWGIVEHSQHQLAFLAHDQIVARAAALPFSWDGNPDSLPIRGWDEVIERSVVDTFSGADLTTLCGLEISFATGHEGEDLSSTVLIALHDHASRAGFDRLIFPLHLRGKAQHPYTPMREYIDQRRPDGLPTDDWLRLHERIGGKIIGICPSAMSIIAPLREWRQWTQLPLAETGLIAVPGGTAPVFVNVEHDYAAYVEANVWVSYDISA
jgi:hypothetical protein